MISSFTSPSSSSSSPSPASSVAVRVEKATSELLMGPDWTLNIDICDTINSSHWLAKDVVKTLKKRLQHKSPQVQLLSLTLLETVVKNCGDNVHFQIAERNILQDMVKIVKKKTDMHVRDKILALLDSWQQAFGGPAGKYTQYYWAYDELRRYGVQFPQRANDAAPIFTPPRQHQPGYGMPSNSSRRLDEAMAAEMEDLSLSTISSMGEVLHLLADMLQAVNPDDHTGVRDEVIVDLVDRCRANQKKLMQMLATTRDEKLLAQGLELNDSLQSVLAKHDAIASGAVFPNSGSAIDEQSSETRDPALKLAEEGPNDTAAVDAKPPNPIVDEEEEDDDFAQLARRHSKVQPQMEGRGCSDRAFSGSAAMNSALVLRDPPAPIKTTREGEDSLQEFLGGLTLATTVSFTPPHTPTQDDHTNQTPLPPLSPPPPITTTNNLGHQTPFNNYVAPWARVSPPHSEPDPPPQVQSHHFINLPHHPSAGAYPPPPWAATPGYSITNPPNPSPPVTTNVGSNHGAGPRTGVGLGLSSSIAPAANAHKTFVPSYRLFEDLNVFGNNDRKMKAASAASNSSGGTSGKQT